jgi:hypothetical protein
MYLTATCNSTKNNKTECIVVLSETMNYQGFKSLYIHVTVSQGTVYISLLPLLSDVQNIKKNKTLQFIHVFTYLFPVSHILPDDDPVRIETCCLF